MSQKFENYVTGDDTKLDSYGNRWVAQSFTTTVAYTITSAKLLLYRTGTCAHTITVYVTATDGDGKPTGAALCSGTTDGSTLPTASPYEWREVSFGAGAKLNAATVYALIFKCPAGTPAPNDFASWRDDSSSPAYTGGQAGLTLDGGGTWTMYSGHDLLFENWGNLPGGPIKFIANAPKLAQAGAI